MTDCVKELWRFPVKSMQGESLPATMISAYGLLGDRAYGLLDVETGKIASAKKVRLFPNLMQCRATFVEPPQLGYAAPPVEIRLPDGRTVRSDDAAVDRVLSGCFDRDMRLVRATPGIATDAQYRPDADEAAQSGSGAEMIGTGAFRDAYPVSMLTTATLDRFGELQPDSRFDARRFRMNIIIDTAQVGFVENDWLERTLDFAGEIRLNIAARDSRCVMTTLPQAELPHDPEILRGVARHNRVHVAGSGDRPCAGVYARVAAAGVARVGDAISLV